MKWNVNLGTGDCNGRKRSNVSPHSRWSTITMSFLPAQQTACNYWNIKGLQRKDKVSYEAGVKSELYFELNELPVGSGAMWSVWNKMMLRQTLLRILLSRGHSNAIIVARYLARVIHRLKIIIPISRADVASSEVTWHQAQRCAEEWFGHSVVTPAVVSSSQNNYGTSTFICISSSRYHTFLERLFQCLVYYDLDIL